MKAFKEWQSKRAIKTIGYLNNSDAFKAGEELGWRAALEWVLEECIYTEDDGHTCISQGMIDEELGEE